MPSRTAIHEAGHALACVLLNVGINFASVEPDGDRDGWVEHVAVTGARPTRAQAMKEATICVAGEAAEVMSFGDATGLRSDLACLLDLERRYGGPLRLDAQRQARALLLTHGRELLAAARDLDTFGTLDEADVRTAMESVGWRDPRLSLLDGRWRG